MGSVQDSTREDLELKPLLSTSTSLETNIETGSITEPQLTSSSSVATSPPETKNVPKAKPEKNEETKILRRKQKSALIRIPAVETELGMEMQEMGPFQSRCPNTNSNDDEIEVLPVEEPPIRPDFEGFEEEDEPSARALCVCCGIVLAILLIIASLLSAAVLYFVYVRYIQSPDVCDSAVCAEAATFLYNRINPDQDPCEDFYEHACGRFEETHPTATPGFNMFSSIDSSTKSVFHRIMKDGNPETNYEKTMINLYRMCVRQNHTDEPKMIKEILDYISTIAKFPLIDPTWTEADYNLTDMMAKMAKSGVLGLGLVDLVYIPSVDGQVPGKIRIQPIELKEEFKKVHQVLFYLDLHAKFFENDVGGVADFEKELQEKIDNARLRLSKDGSYMKDLNFLQKHIPEVNWTHVLNSLVPSLKTQNYPDWQERVQVFEPAFFEEELPRLLANYTTRDIANFFLYNLVSETLFLMPLEVTSIWLEDDIHRKEDNCRMHILELMPLHYGMLHASRYTSPKNIEGAKLLTEEVREEFKELVTESPWLNEKSKAETTLKIEKIGMTIGYPEHYNDPNMFDKRFDQCDIKDSDSYFTTIMKVLKFGKEKDALDIVNDRNIYVQNVGSSSVVYSVFENYLSIGAPLTKMPYYDIKAPEYYNYGHMGCDIGTGIAQGFEVHGMKWNAEYTPIYSDNTIDTFATLGQCFEKKYKQNEEYTESQFMADYVGLQIAYRMAKKLARKDQPKLPGFQNFDHLQMFFYTYASSFCTIQPDDEKYNSKNAKIGLDRVRLNGVLSNFDGFSDAFNCSKKALMNPKKKCGTLFSV